MDETCVVNAHFADRFVDGSAVCSHARRQTKSLPRPQDVKRFLVDLQSLMTICVLELPELPWLRLVTLLPKIYYNGWIGGCDGFEGCDL